MRSEVYFTFHATEDGEVYAEQVSHNELLEQLSEGNYYGKVQFINALPEMHDMREWGSGNLLIIKGEIVVPTAKEVIKVFDVK